MRALIESEIHRKQALDAIAALRIGGKRRYVFELKLWRRPRSLDQNRLYWMWLRAVQADTGNEPNALNEYYKHEFLMDRSVTVEGVVVKVPRSTKDLNTEEFSQFLQRVHDHTEDFFNVMLPWPDSIGWDSLCARYGGDQ